MRSFSTLFLTVVTLMILGPQELLAVKLKNVTQNGSGSSGSIKIEFNGDYNKSSITTNYSVDRVDLVIPNAFVVPVRKVFKSSSAKASVTKIEAVNVSGRSLKLSIHFKGAPMDVIKKTAKLSGKGNIVSFDYSTILGELAQKDQSAEVQPLPKEVKEKAATVPVPTVNTVEAKSEIKKAPVMAATIPSVNNNAGNDSIKIEEKSSFKSTIKKYLFALAGFFKVAFLIVLFGVVVFVLFFIIRRYANRAVYKSEEKSFGYTKVENASTTNNPINTADIKIINSIDLESDKKLYVVDVMGERMLIASGKNYVSMLSRLQNETKDGQGYLFNDPSSQTMTEQQAVIMKTRLKDRLNNI